MPGAEPQDRPVRPTDLAVIANNANLPTLAGALNGIWATLEKQAAINLRAAGEMDAYTAIEQKAMLRTEMLNQVKGLDLASVMLKGRLIKEIRNEALFNVHPGAYGTLEALAQDQGISISELSQIVDLCETIFPYLQTQLMNINEIWEKVGKSNMRELVPVLKRTINGVVVTGTVEATYQRVLADVEATAAATGEAFENDEAKTKFIVDLLLERGATMTNAAIRQVHRPDPTPSINALVFPMEHGEKFSVTFVVDERQYQMVERRLHGYWDPVRVTPEDTRAARTALRAHAAGLAELLNLV